MKFSLKSIVRRIDRIIFFYFGRKKVLFFIENAIGLRRQIGLIRSLQNNRGVSIYILVSDRCEIEVNERNLGLNNIKRVSLKKSLWCSFSCIVVTDKYLRWHYRDVLVYYINHGSAMGNQDISRPEWRIETWRSHNSNVCAINSKAEYDHLIKYTNNLLSDEAKIFTPSGYFFENNISIDQVRKSRKSIGIADGYKVVVLCSHFTEMSLLRNVGIELINWLLDYSIGLYVIVTGHPKIWIDGLGSVNKPSEKLWEKLTELAKNERVFFYSSPSNDNLLSLGDYFICDYSSVRIEIAKYEKPVFLYIHPDFSFQSELTGPLYKKSSICFSSTDEFAKRFSSLEKNGSELPEIKNSELLSYFNSGLDPIESHLNTINSLVDIPYIGSKQWRQFRNKSSKELAKLYGD
jgi:hypothetical protein